MLRRLFCLLALAGCWAGAAGQTRLTFVDATTGERVPYVQVLFGEGEGRYSDESGSVTIPASVTSVRVSHISYESLSLDLGPGLAERVPLTRVAMVLQPAVIRPKNLSRVRVGHASDKRDVPWLAGSGITLGEYFARAPEWPETALITGVRLNLFTIILKQQVKATIEDQEYDDGRILKAKLRVDLREVDSGTGGPGASLIDGGVIYSIPDQVKLQLHHIHKITLPQPVLCPAEGVFAVVEWIVTDEVREQDSVVPKLWCTRAGDPSSAWIKRVGKPWTPLNDTTTQTPRNFCLDLELLK